MIEEQIEKIKNIAIMAGEKIIELYDKYDPEVDDKTVIAEFIQYKSDKSPVTGADLAANQIIESALQTLTPDIPVISEENHSSLMHLTKSKNFWLVDPLDGTKEFIKKNGEFTVNIALIQNHKPIFGVIFAPVLNELYWGSQKTGAFCIKNGIEQSISVNPSSQTKTKLIVCGSKSHLSKKTFEWLESLNKPYELHQVGSSLKFCRIAEGSADLYPRLGPTCEWDTAAGQAIVESAGGFVTSFDGDELVYGKNNILNPNFIVSSYALDF